MDKLISQTTRQEVLKKLRRRYERADAEHKRKLLDQPQELLGYLRRNGTGEMLGFNAADFEP